MILDTARFSIEFLFPASCPLCGSRVSTNGELCSDCWAAFNWISAPRCVKCGYPFPANLDLGAAPLCPNCASGDCVLDLRVCMTAHRGQPYCRLSTPDESAIRHLCHVQ